MTDIVEVMAATAHELPVDWSRPTPWPMLSESVRVEWRKKIRAALAALEQAGYAVVPVVPTEGMISACAGALQAHIDAMPIEIRNRYRNFKHGLKVPPRLKAVARYRAMLSAYKHPAADPADPTRREGQDA